MLHDDLTLATLMVHDQYIDEFKIKSMSKKLNRSGPCEKDKPRFKKRSQTQYIPSVRKVKREKGGGSQDKNPTCATC